MTEQTAVSLPLVLRSHHDGRFAVAVTERLADGSLVVMVQESIGSGRSVTILSADELRQMLAVAEASR